jgi:hypothetical protein
MRNLRQLNDDNSKAYFEKNGMGEIAVWCLLDTLVEFSNYIKLCPASFEASSKRINPVSRDK